LMATTTVHGASLIPLGQKAEKSPPIPCTTRTKLRNWED
jgi:hypothetical protein